MAQDKSASLQEIFVRNTKPPKGITVDQKNKTITIDMEVLGQHNWLHGKRSFQAGGPGSGRHKELGSLSHEEKLAERRRLQQEQYALYKKQGLNARGKPLLSDKAQLARKNFVAATKGHHDKAEEIERLMAKKTGLTKSSGNKPFDIFGKKDAVEVKTVLMQKNDKLTMNRDAIARKNAWAKANKVQSHTLAVDLRGQKPVYYHREGVGSFRLGTMNKVSGSQLRTMFK